MRCDNAEYKKLDQDTSLGQLYKIQNEIKILYKAKVGPTHFLWHKHQLNKQKIDETVR